ncbi:hypothetical protein RAS1_05280 [Phycisphaerae bacterium RAS1]|nr:hypothetical protein RAS1_05280 [Phycisphaerae bacterium RAS1]
MFSRRLCALRLVIVAFSFPIIGGCPPPEEPAPSGADNAADNTNSSIDDPSRGDAAFEFVLGAAAVEAADRARPEAGSPIRDPAFHTSLVRVSDAARDVYDGPRIQNEYAKVDPENCDGTLLLLRGNSATYYLYSVETWRLLRRLTAFESCGQEPEPRWDASDPNVFYFVCNSELRRYNVATDAATIVHDFRAEFPAGAYVNTKIEGDASLDRRFWAFLVQDESWSRVAVVVYDRTADALTGQKTADFREGLDWVGMSMTGQYCALGWDAYVAPLTTTLVSRDFTAEVDLPDGSAGHGDFALSADGRDVYVYQNVRTDYIAMTDPATGDETPLLRIPFDVNPDIGMHISGNAAKTPGWVLVSTYGSLNPPEGSRHSWMDAQLFMLELRADPRIWRLAHTHSYTSRGFTDEKNYFAESFAALNTAGTRVYFGSNWGDLARTDYTDAYVLQLPPDWRAAMPR